jgi:hypothetical protein
MAIAEQQQQELLLGSRVDAMMEVMLQVFAMWSAQRLCHGVFKLVMALKFLAVKFCKSSTYPNINPNPVCSHSAI